MTLGLDDLTNARDDAEDLTTSVAVSSRFCNMGASGTSLKERLWPDICISCSMAWISSFIFLEGASRDWWEEKTSATEECKDDLLLMWTR